MVQRVLLATFSNTLSLSPFGSLLPAVLHFDPFGTEFREPGRVSYPIFQTLHAQIIGRAMRIVSYKDPSNLLRSSWRPRASRDLTVPTLISSAVAISS